MAREPPDRLPPPSPPARPAGYRPRSPRESPLFRVFADHYPAFVAEYEQRHQRAWGHPRRIVDRTVRGFLRCGLLGRLMETSPLGISVVDREGSITYANRRAEQILGLRKEEITQRVYNAPAWRITDFDGAPLPDDELPFSRVLASGQSVRDVRHAIEWPDGRRVLLSVNASPLFDAAGELDRVIATIDDVTLRGITLTEDRVATSLELAPGSYARLAVRDTGIGMSRELRDRIFEPFFTTKGVGEGTGMGLSVVHGIVKAAGGAILVESEPGEGAAFQVLLPTCSAAPTEASGGEDGDHGSRGEGRVLVVDDEPALARVTARVLTSRGDRCQTAHSGADALEAIAGGGAFDLVLVDQAMPGMTGAPVTRRVLELRPEMPVLIWTGHSDVLDEQRALELGARGLLSKPLSAEQLARRVAETLDLSSNPSAP